MQRRRGLARWAVRAGSLVSGGGLERRGLWDASVALVCMHARAA